jgi:hypothetical protein
MRTNDMTKTPEALMVVNAIVTLEGCDPAGLARAAEAYLLSIGFGLELRTDVLVEVAEALANKSGPGNRGHDAVIDALWNVIQARGQKVTR